MEIMKTDESASRSRYADMFVGAVITALVGVVFAPLGAQIAYRHDDQVRARAEQMRTQAAVTLFTARLQNDAFFVKPILSSLDKGEDFGRIRSAFPVVAGLHRAESLVRGFDPGALNADVLEGIDQYDRVVDQAVRAEDTYRQALSSGDSKEATKARAIYAECLRQVVEVADGLLGCTQKYYPLYVAPSPKPLGKSETVRIQFDGKALPQPAETR
jgi:hypothetical protein